MKKDRFKSGTERTRGIANAERFCEKNIDKILRRQRKMGQTNLKAFMLISGLKLICLNHATFNFTKSKYRTPHLFITNLFYRCLEGFCNHIHILSNFRLT